MAITSWPYTDQDTTDIEYSRLFREMSGDGVVGSFGATTLRVTADSSGMNVKVSSGSAIVRGYMMLSTATETLTIQNSSSTLERIDRVVLELNLSDPNVTERIKPKVIRGTSASVGNAVAPALDTSSTDSYQISLATVLVSPSVSTIASSKVSDDRNWIDQMVGVWDSDSKRPSSPRKYKLGFNDNRNTFEYWDGIAWVSINDHNHSLSGPNITGTLPVSKGGTGATTKSAARAALGIYVQSSAPSDPDTNDLWVKRS